MEVGRIGREGFVGMAAILGAGHSPYRFFMALPGHGYAINAKTLLLQTEASSHLRNVLLRSVHSYWYRPRKPPLATVCMSFPSAWLAGC